VPSFRATGAVVPETTFLDLVRSVAVLTRAECDPECSLAVHRRDAASVLITFYENPILVRRLARSVGRRYAEAPDGYDPEEEI
jgi:hypothetical protein